MKPWKFDPAALHEKLKGSPHVEAVVLAQLGAKVLVTLGDFTTETGAWKSPEHSPSYCAIDIKREALKLGLLGKIARNVDEARMAQRRSLGLLGENEVLP